MGIRSDTLERYRFEGAVVVLTIRMACGRTEGGGVVGGGLCKGTLGKDGIIAFGGGGTLGPTTLNLIFVYSYCFVEKYLLRANKYF